MKTPNLLYGTYRYHILTECSIQSVCKCIRFTLNLWKTGDGGGCIHVGLGVHVLIV